MSLRKSFTVTPCPDRSQPQQRSEIRRPAHGAGQSPVADERSAERGAFTPLSRSHANPAIRPALRGGKNSAGDPDPRRGCEPVVCRTGRDVSPNRNRGGSGNPPIAPTAGFLKKRILFLKTEAGTCMKTNKNTDKMPDEKPDIYVKLTRILRKMAVLWGQFAANCIFWNEFGRHQPGIASNSSVPNVDPGRLSLCS